MIELLPDRENQVVRKDATTPAADMVCGKASTAEKNAKKNQRKREKDARRKGRK